MVRLSAGSMVFLLLVGVGLIVVGVHMGRKEYAIMKAWPKADAVVISSSVLEGRGKHGNTPVYSLSVQLKYTVAGKVYIRDAQMSGWATSSRSSSQKLVDDYRPGTHYMVPYNPDSPSEAYMQLGGNFATFSGPLICLLLGFGFALPGLRRLFKLTFQTG